MPSKKRLGTNNDATVNFFKQMMTNVPLIRLKRHLINNIYSGIDFNIVDKQAANNTALIWAVANCNIDKVLHLIQWCKKLNIFLDLNKQDIKHFNSALSLAVTKGPKHKGDKPWKNQTKYMLSVIESLLENGANVNTRNVKGDTPLHIAILRRDTELVELLLKHGARVDIQNNQGKTPDEMVECTYTSANEYMHEHGAAYTLKNCEEWKNELDSINRIIMSDAYQEVEYEVEGEGELEPGAGSQVIFSYEEAVNLPTLENIDLQKDVASEGVIVSPDIAHNKPHYNSSVDIDNNVEEYVALSKADDNFLPDPIKQQLLYQYDAAHKSLPLDSNKQHNDLSGEEKLKEAIKFSLKKNHI